jgi:hypothetical protein
VALILLQLLSIAPRSDLPSVELVYSRAPGAERCPDQRGLRQAVIDRLGYDPFRASAERRMSVAIVPMGTTLTAKLSVESREGDFLGTQQLSGTPVDCLALSRALSLALSLAIDPRSLDAASEPAPEPAPSRSLVVSVVRPQPRLPAPEQRWRAMLGISTALGAAPEPELGVHAGAQFRDRRFSFELDARADLPSATQSIAGPFASSLLVAELAPCYRPLWTLDVCALALAGLELSTDSGQVGRHSSADSYAAAGGRLSAELVNWELLALRLSADLVAPFVRRRFVVDLPSGPGQLWNTPPVQGALALDVVLGF